MEVFDEIRENVRGEDVFVIQSTSYPANDRLMELLVCLDLSTDGYQRRGRPPASAESRVRSVQMLRQRFFFLRAA